VAFVRPRPGATATLDELRAHVLAADLAAHTAPEQLEVVDDLPRTPPGKVREADLRARLRAATR